MNCVYILFLLSIFFFLPSTDTLATTTIGCCVRIVFRDASLVVLCTLQGQLSTIHTSHQIIQFQCGARGSCSQCGGWNGIRLSPGETGETDRDVAGLNERADCDPWVSQCSSTWAGSSSWERCAGWHWVGSKWEGWSNHLILTYLVGCSPWFGCYINVCSTHISSGQGWPQD